MFLRLRAGLAYQPQTDQLHDILALRLIQFHARWNAMPFGQTSATACGGGMLSHERRVTAHRRLFAIVFRPGGCQTAVDKIAGMAEDQRQPLILQVGLVFDIEVKFGAER